MLVAQGQPSPSPSDGESWAVPGASVLKKGTT